MLFYQVNKTSVYCGSVSARAEISAALFTIISPQRNSAIVGPLLQIIWFFHLRQEVLFSLFFKGHASLFVSRVHLFFLSLSLTSGGVGACVLKQNDRHVTKVWHTTPWWFVNRIGAPKRDVLYNTAQEATHSFLELSSLFNKRSI